MEFKAVADTLELNEEWKQKVSRKWEISERSCPETADFLKTEFIRRSFPLLRYKEDLTEALCNTAEQIRRIPELHHFAWHLYHRIFLDPEREWLPPYLPPEKLLGENTGLFNLLIALGSVPLIDRAYEKRRIPKEMVAEHHTWLGGTIDIFRAAHNGRCGHDLRQTAWLRLAADGTLFRVGRFEFLMEPYPMFCPAVYKNRESGKIAVLARDGWKYDAQWRRLPHSAENPAHTAFLNDTGDSVEGIQLLHNGRVNTEAPLALNKKVWEPIAAPWDLVPTMHIPAGGGMTPGLTHSSLIQARAFFRQYHHREIPMICCHSWILNPEWQRLLPDSNLAAFQRSVFQVDCPAGNGKDGLFFVFGRDDGDPLKEYPADNSMRRAVLQVLREGKPLRSGIMLLPAHELELYGNPEMF